MCCGGKPIPAATLGGKGYFGQWQTFVEAIRRALEPAEKALTAQLAVAVSILSFAPVRLSNLVARDRVQCMASLHGSLEL